MNLETMDRNRGVLEDTSNKITLEDIQIKQDKMSRELMFHRYALIILAALILLKK